MAMNTRAHANRACLRGIHQAREVSLRLEAGTNAIALPPHPGDSRLERRCPGPAKVRRACCLCWRQGQVGTLNVSLKAQRKSRNSAQLELPLSRRSGMLTTDWLWFIKR